MQRHCSSSVRPEPARPAGMTDTVGEVGSGDLVVMAATVVVPSGLLRPGAVVVRGDRIVDVRPWRGVRPPPDTVVAPGFIDLQVNGSGPISVAAARGEADWRTLDRRLVAGGVTSWCPTLVTMPADRQAAALTTVARARRSHWTETTIVGAHLEGPYLTVPGAHDPTLLDVTVPDGWAENLPPVTRIVTLAPELPGALDAIAALRRRGLLVALGHSACSAEQAIAAIDAGARLVTHVGNASGAFHQRRPGLLGAALADRRVAVSVIADGVHLHPVTLRMILAAKGPGRVVLVSDAVADDGLGPVKATGAAGDGPSTGGPPSTGIRTIARARPVSGTRPSMGARPIAGARPAAGAWSDVTMEPATVTGPDGVLMGTAMPMAELVGRCAVVGDLGLHGAVTAAATTPARLLGLDDRGVLTPGRRADLVGLQWLGGRLRVRAVWVGGRLVHQEASPGSARGASPPHSIDGGVSGGPVEAGPRGAAARTGRRELAWWCTRRP